MGHRVRLRVVPPPVYRKPTNEERAAWYAENRTSVPQEVERTSICRWAGEWCGVFGWLACEGIAWVVRKVRR